MEGTIFKVLLSKGFGFIAARGQPDGIFFHQDELDHELPFNEQLMERRVTFDFYQDNQSGRRKALRVRAAE